MNSRQIVASLNQIANELDSLGKIAEANEITKVMVKISQQPIFGTNPMNTGNYVPSGVDSNFTNIPIDPGYAKRSESLRKLPSEFILPIFIQFPSFSKLEASSLGTSINLLPFLSESTE